MCGRQYCRDVGGLARVRPALGLGVRLGWLWGLGWADFARIGCPTYPRQWRGEHIFGVPLRARVCALALLWCFLQGEAGINVFLIKAPGTSIRPHADKIKQIFQSWYTRTFHDSSI